jgi:hypothetical protein
MAEESEIPVVVPGHPAGSWRYEENGPKRSPTPAELSEIFDEQSGIGTLSADSWLALRRLAETLDGVSDQFGQLVCRPERDDFDPVLLEDEISPERLDALAAGQAEPTVEELARWEAIYMQQARENAGRGVFVVLGWTVRDERGRERVLVTLHVDQGSFERVAGLFVSIHEAQQSLREYGEFEWLW